MSEFTKDDDALLDELGITVASKPEGVRTPAEERVIAAFEEIQRFVAQHNRVPQHAESRDTFERMYAVRLDRIRALADCRSLLAPLDNQGLLSAAPVADVAGDALNDDELLAQLGVQEDAAAITQLRHVRSATEKRDAEEIANRQKCEDFDRFAPVFAEVRRDLDAGTRVTRPFNAIAGIKEGELFIVGGQIAYVAEVGQEFMTEYDRRDSRLRVIYDNATESNVLMRSLERALHRDSAGRRITDLSAGPLFADDAEEGDAASGTIYVLRSKSDHPLVEANRTVLHKIGVTGGDVNRRIANAWLDPTYLMADVELVATYKLANLNRAKLESLIHRVFGSARLDIEIRDKSGNAVVPAEWFLVPIFVIDEAIEKIKDGSIVNFTYDPTGGRLVRVG